MTLRSAIATDAATVFCNTSDFAETVTYYPHTYYGETARDSRSISAVVIREDMEVVSEDGDTVLPVFQVFVINSNTTGISSDELDLGGDAIELPPRDGKTAEKKRIQRIVSQDNGMLELQCL